MTYGPTIVTLCAALCLGATHAAADGAKTWTLHCKDTCAAVNGPLALYPIGSETTPALLPLCVLDGEAFLVYADGRAYTLADQFAKRLTPFWLNRLTVEQATISIEKDSQVVAVIPMAGLKAILTARGVDLSKAGGAEPTNALEAMEATRDAAQNPVKRVPVFKPQVQFAFGDDALPPNEPRSGCQD
ncbi:MAG: hypothetical protein AAGO57_04140 [Pseudomonadota bacterium]